jgi:hypothetical protein
MNLNLPKEPFSVVDLQNLYSKCCLDAKKELKKKTNDDEDDDKKTLSNEDKIKVFKPVINYIQSYYLEIDKGNYYFYDVLNDEFILKEKKDFKAEVLIKLKDEYINGIMDKNNKVYRITCNLNKPRLFEENKLFYINECKGFLHKNYKPFNEYSNDIKKKVQMLLDMIFEISCSNNKELFDAYIKYYSKLSKGEKTEVIIYKKSADQGTGKSFETSYFIKFVFGEPICLISNTEPLIKDFNKILMGKLFVVFEELPTFSPAQWEGVSSKLKTLTTEDKTIYRGLFKEPIMAENIGNFFINTNVESLKDSHGRRIIIMPVNTSRLGDYDYFENITKNCFNMEVGEAFYSYLRGIDTSNFYAQRDFPETEIKKLAIANLLPAPQKFLKFMYVLKNRGINNVKPKDLHKEFEEYCSANNIKSSLNKNKFMEALEPLGIKFIKSHGENIYKVSLDQLKEIATKRKWVCSYDEEEHDDDDDDDDEDSDDETSNQKKSKLNIIWKQKYIELEKEMNKLKKRLNIKDDE